MDILELRLRGRWGEKSKAIEAYTRPDVVVLPPERIWNQLPQYRRVWKEARLLFICRNIVETKGDFNHPHMVMMRTYFPKVCYKYRYLLPVAFPFHLADDRWLTMQEARKSRVYLRKVAAKRNREAKANAYRSQLAKELRKDAVARIKAAATGSGFLAAEKIAQIEAVIEGVHSCQAGTQTEKVRVVSEEDWQLLQRVKALQIAADTPKSAQGITNPQTEVPLFKVSTPQGELLLTKPEFNELKLHCPQAKVASSSISNRAKDNLRTKIRRRVSSKYRKMKDAQQARWLLNKKGYKKEQLPKVPRYRQTATIK